MTRPKKGCTSPDYLPEFLAFYFPLAHAAIDWFHGSFIPFSIQELAQSSWREARAGHFVRQWKLIDWLEVCNISRIRNYSGCMTQIYEVQGQPDMGSIAERLFVYTLPRLRSVLPKADWPPWR